MNLLEAMNTEYSISKLWLSANFFLTGLFFICLIITAATSAPWVKWVVFAAFLLQVSAAGARLRSSALYSLGESVRRAAMLHNGLGTRISPIQVARISAKHKITRSNEGTTFDKYYESTTHVGPQRLLEITEESAFWTEELAERMATLLKRVILAVLLIVLLAFIAAVQSNLGGAHGEMLAKILMGTLTVWCTGDLLTLWRRYDSLMHSAQRVLEDCQAIRSRGEIGYEPVVTLGEYNCCLAAAPIIPEFIYKHNRDRLNSAWASRNAHDPSRA